MNAIVYHRYGSPDVVVLEARDRPRPADDEVLVKVHASSLNSYDWRHVRARPVLVRMREGWARPHDPRLGADFAGTVAEVGRGVTGLREGDEVFGCVERGAWAEFVAVSPSKLARKPAGLSFDLAAALPMAGLTAWQGLKEKGRLAEGEHVLIHGASGGVGSMAVEIAKALGAIVTAVTRPKTVDFVRELGADQVLDSTQVDFTRTGVVYDLVFDVSATRTARDYQRALAPNGRYVMAGFSTLFHAAALSWQGPRVARDGQSLGLLGMVQIRTPDLEQLGRLADEGRLRPRLDQTYPWENVRQALWDYETKGARGKLSLSIVAESAPG